MCALALYYRSSPCGSNPDFSRSDTYFFFLFVLHSSEAQRERSGAHSGDDRARRNMSARVLNPAMMTEISRNLSSGGGGGGGSGRAAPSRAALARVRRDLFGPVDHAAAQALAERELRAQSQLDANRWGFNFQKGAPLKSNPRYEWEPLTEHDVVPEPYALRGMPFLRKHAPGHRANCASTTP